MIKVLTLVAMLLPFPAAAMTIDQMTGSWSGEGDAAHRGEPSVRFRCRIRLQPQGSGTAVFSGRCATTQGQQSFTYLVIENSQGVVTAQNQSQPRDQLPSRLSGRATPSQVRFEDGSSRMFELMLSDGRLRLRIQGTDRGRPTRGQVWLTRQN